MPWKHRGDYVLLFRAGDLVAPTGLYCLAGAIEADPDVAVLYGDQDELDAKGRRVRPWFKPQWNDELFLAQDYLSRAVALGATVARQHAMGVTRSMSCSSRPRQPPRARSSTSLTSSATGNPRRKLQRLV